jgi:hypothetical protein
VISAALFEPDKIMSSSLFSFAEDFAVITVIFRYVFKSDFYQLQQIEGRQIRSELKRENNHEEHVSRDISANLEGKQPPQTSKISRGLPLLALPKSHPNSKKNQNQNPQPKVFFEVVLRTPPQLHK